MTDPAVPIKIGYTDFEVQLTADAERKADIEVDEGEECWLPVLGTFIQDKKLKFVVGLPWIPEDGDPKEDEEDWFLPAVIADKDLYAMREKDEKEVDE